jgi:Na+-driven multidrug efflux pump
VRDADSMTRTHHPPPLWRNFLKFLGPMVLANILQSLSGTGVWMAYPIAFTSMLVLQATYYRAVWRKKKIERLV